MRGQEQPGNPSEAAGQAAGKELPDAPGETKKESATPAQAVEDKTKEALDITKDVAQVGFVRARDWESTWITGVFIGKNEPLVSPTTKQREEIYLRQTLTTPGAYMKRAFGALIDQARGTPSQWDDGWGGYAERFASREGQFITANSLAALGNAKLGYEVRYDQCKCRGLWPRTRHAIIRNLLTYDRSEEHLRPQLGAVWRSVCWRSGGNVVEAAEPECAVQWRVCGVGAVGVWNAAEFCYGVCERD